MPPQPWRNSRCLRPNSARWSRLSRVSRKRSSNSLAYSRRSVYHLIDLVREILSQLGTGVGRVRSRGGALFFLEARIVAGDTLRVLKLVKLYAVSFVSRVCAQFCLCKFV